MNETLKKNIIAVLQAFKTKQDLHKAVGLIFRYHPPSCHCENCFIFIALEKERIPEDNWNTKFSQAILRETMEMIKEQYERADANVSCA